MRARLSRAACIGLFGAALVGLACSGEPETYPPGLPWSGGVVETGGAEVPTGPGTLPDGGTPGQVDFITNTTSSGIRSFVVSNRYEHWRKTSTRTIASDHGDTRGIVFINPTLYEGLDGPAPYPDRSAAILRVLDGEEVLGYNVLVKEGGRWLFYKDISPTLFGYDPPDCSSCHNAGSDYRRTPRSAF